MGISSLSTYVPSFKLHAIETLNGIRIIKRNVQEWKILCDSGKIINFKKKEGSC
jgi:hypothetical protein